VPIYRNSLEKALELSTKEQKGRDWFEVNWNDYEWKISHCPGKQILRELKKWCNDKYKISLTENLLIESIEEIHSNLVNIISTVQNFFGNK
jgi:hypothetical protein